MSWLLKFADDTKIFRPVNSMADCDVLQLDLTRLEHWAAEWQMLFNVDKCKVMYLGSRNQKFSYTMSNLSFQTVNEEKDLGVHMTADLKSSRHCLQAKSKANQILGMINRTFKYTRI